AGTSMSLLAAGAPTAILLASLLFLPACTPSSARYTSSRPARSNVTSPDSTDVGEPPSSSPRHDDRTSTEAAATRPTGRNGAGSIAPVASPLVNASSRVSREDNPRIDRHRVLSSVMGMMGAPYAEGGSDTGGIDCSGFTARVYREAIGSEIPRSCREQF